MNSVYDSFCGTYCGVCPTMVETQAARLGEDRQCYGYKSEKNTGYCSTCRMRACAEGKGFSYCFQCNELKSCELMKKFISDPQWPHAKIVLKNLEMIRVKGLQKWLDTQEKRWRCDHCGAA